MRAWPDLCAASGVDRYFVGASNGAAKRPKTEHHEPRGFQYRAAAEAVRSPSLTTPSPPPPPPLPPLSPPANAGSPTPATSTAGATNNPHRRAWDTAQKATLVQLVEKHPDRRKMPWPVMVSVLSELAGVQRTYDNSAIVLRTISPLFLSSILPATHTRAA